MKTYVGESSFLQQPALKAGNDQLEFIIVPGWGSNLISLFDKKTNSELLRVPNNTSEFWDRPVLYGTPILFPPNRIDRGTFTFANRTYQFDINEEDKQNHLHGFVHTRPWEVKKAEASGDNVTIITEFDSSNHEEVLRQFPHHFIIRMTYLLNGNLLMTKADIVNKSVETMPIGLGFHTTFLFPEESSKLRLSVEKRWSLNERYLPTGELEDIPYHEELQNGMSLVDMKLDDVFLSAADTGGLPTAKLENSLTGVDITYKVDENFKHWVVYNNDGKSGFLCPEPYTWVTNAPNLSVPPSLSGVQGLEPGGSNTYRTWLVFSHKS